MGVSARRVVVAWSLLSTSNNHSLIYTWYLVLVPGRPLTSPEPHPRFRNKPFGIRVATFFCFEGVKPADIVLWCKPPVLHVNQLQNSSSGKVRAFRTQSGSFLFGLPPISMHHKLNVRATFLQAARGFDY